jgi:hypothetical protein
VGSHHQGWFAGIEQVGAMNVLVCGPELSGNRMTAEILRHAGAKVIRLSFPHAGEWPDLNAIFGDGELLKDWANAVVIVVRGCTSHAYSRVTNGWSSSLWHARWLAFEAMRRVTEQLSHWPHPMQGHVFIVTYESGVLHRDEIAYMLEDLGLEPMSVPENAWPRDGNAAFYGGEDFTDHRLDRERVDTPDAYAKTSGPGLPREGSGSGRM